MTREEWNALKAGDEIKTATQNNHFDVVETKDDMELHRVLLRNKKTGKEFYSRQFDIFTVYRMLAPCVVVEMPKDWHTIVIRKSHNDQTYTVAWQMIGGEAKQTSELTKGEALDQIAAMMYTGTPQFSDDAASIVSRGAVLLKGVAKP